MLGAVKSLLRLVTVYNPKMVVIYEGDNDMFFLISPETLRATYLSFISKVPVTLPDVPIYFISIKPSVSRLHLWSQSVTANTLIEALAHKIYFYTISMSHQLCWMLRVTFAKSFLLGMHFT